MNDLQKELNALKAKVAELESRIVAKHVAKWQPESGQYLIMSNGEIVEASQTSINDTMAKLFGTRRDTYEQAERAAVEMRKFNRLLALRDELCGDEVVDWGVSTEKFIIYFNHHQSKWMFARYESRQDVTVHFVDLESAQKACDMLNSGEVEL